ncbi:MAG: homocysteine S-methyltransferase family protein [Paracoccaceae bacterium]
MTDRLTILDGGMGQELVARGQRPASPLWSAQFLIDRPDLVAEAHADYIAAGAEVITLNSYSATRRRLAREGSEDRFEALQDAAIDAALRARDGAGRAVRIAGCLPPLVASYRPETMPAEDEAVQEYREIAERQLSHVDLFLCETMASVAEARAATAAAASVDKPVWCALTVDDEDGARLRSGEPVGDGVRAAREAGAEAVLVNCSTPEAVTVALPLVAAAAEGLPVGAYANAFVTIAPLAPGKTVDVLETRRDLDPATYAEFAAGWRETGAAILGGCCGVGPGHIAELARRLGRAVAG